VDTDPPSADPLIGTVLGRHLILRLVGAGGMGLVYEGTHQDLDRRAAVKVLHERYARRSELQRRFLREGKAASRVRHSNVVAVYDVGVDRDKPYLVMEYLEGEDLHRTIAREGALSVQRVADLLVPVVSAVATAHDLGIVHRDLKPENIFLSVERGGICPKVLDFGISKLVDRGEGTVTTGTGAFLGTPQYMSPEQALGAKHIDERSDQYSLGVILYQCLTGHRPLDGSSIYALMQRIVRGEFAPPRQLNPDLPVALEALILRAMAREPNERFPGTRALGRALLEHASERVRLAHLDELAVAGFRPTATAPAPSSSQCDVLGTTLGESIAQRDLPTAATRTPRWLGIGALFVAAGTLLVKTWGGSSAVAPTPSAVAAGVAAAGPSAAPQASSKPAYSALPENADTSTTTAGETAATQASSGPRAPAVAPALARVKSKPNAPAASMRARDTAAPAVAPTDPYATQK